MRSDADVQPAPGTVHLDAEEEDHDQQDQADHIERYREAHQFCGGNCATPHISVSATTMLMNWLISRFWLS